MVENVYSCKQFLPAHENLKGIPRDTFLPTHERQIRPIAKYHDAPADQAKCWELAVELADGVRQAFYGIAEQMVLIREDARFHKVDAKGVVKMNRQGEPIRDNVKYLEFLEEYTGYKKSHVYRFLTGYQTALNIAEFSPVGEKIADLNEIPEWTIRPIATKQLNADPERQAEIWRQVVEQAGDKEITAITDDDNNPWFEAAEVCYILGYGHVGSAALKHCKRARILKSTDSVSLEIPPRGLTIIPEPDLYRLIIKSRLPEAEKIDKELDTIANSAFRVGFLFAELKDEFKSVPKPQRKESMDEFCRRRWGIGRKRVSESIAESQTYANLEKSCAQDILPKSGNQMSYLLTYREDPELQAKLWDQAVDSVNGQPTREEVKKVVDAHREANRPKPTGKLADAMKNKKSIEDRQLQTITKGNKSNDKTNSESWTNTRT